MNNNGDSSKLQIQCPVCNQVFTAKLPRAELFNNVLSSGIVAPHERFQKCQNSKCGQAFVLVITGAQLEWNAQAVPPEIVEQVEGTKIITPSLIAH